MSLRAIIAQLSDVVVADKATANYVRTLAKENGRSLKQRKNGGVWELFYAGRYQKATLAWLKRRRADRKSKRKKDFSKHLSC